MFAKLFIVALAIAAVVARPGTSVVTSYSAPVVSPVVSAVAGPAVVATRTYPAYSTYSANYVAASPYTAWAAPHHAYAYGAPLAYSAYASPYTTVY